MLFHGCFQSLEIEKLLDSDGTDNKYNDDQHHYHWTQLLFCRMLFDPKVSLAQTNGADDIKEIESKMFGLLMLDPYFSSPDRGLQPEWVQTLSHLSKTREVGGLFGSAEQVEEAFQFHGEAIRVLEEVGQAVKTSASELQSSIKALKKAKLMEELEIGKQAVRDKKTAEKNELKEKKKKDAVEKAKEAAASEPGGPKRRRAAKSSLEMDDTDPTVLKSKFPNHQISVVDKIETRNCFGCGFSFFVSSFGFDSESDWTGLTLPLKLSVESDWDRSLQNKLRKKV